MFWSNVSLVNNNSHQKKALKNAISLQKLLRKKKKHLSLNTAQCYFFSVALKPQKNSHEAQATSLISNQEATAIADPPLAKLDIEKTC
jgi:hypothetical protein